MAEFDYIRWLRRQVAADPRVPLGIGDDCAAVRWPADKPLLVTTDMLLEGSCFLRDAGGRRIGRKAMAVNLSDIAAMAGQPTAAVISLGLPRRDGEALARDLFAGVNEIASEYNVALVGGDTNTWDGPLVISVTLFGEPTGPGPVRRAGAEPGDWLMVTGSLGGSILGHHLDFTPRVREAQRLHAVTCLKAMIDLSDGLAADLRHLCEASHCGAEVFADRLPISPAARQLNDSRTPLEHALGDGEDFELLFAVGPPDGESLLRDQPLQEMGVNLSHVGRFLSEADLWLVTNQGREPLPNLGYVHRFAGE